MPRSSSDTSWLFFEEKNVSHRVREPHEWYQVHLSFLSHFEHKKIGDTDTNSILTPHLLVFIRFHHQQHWHAVDLQEGAVLLLQLRPLQRRLLRSDRSFHHPQPYSSSPGHQPPMTRFTTISIKFRRQSWIGLFQGQGGPDAANSIPQRPPQPTTLPSYCTQNKHHVPICHIPVDHFGLFIFQDVKTLLWKDYSYNLPFHQSEKAHILKESKLNSSDFLYICGLWRGLNRRKRFPFNWFDLSPPIHFHPFSKSTLQQYLWFKRFS